AGGQSCSSPPLSRMDRRPPFASAIACPAHKAVIDRRWTVFRRTIAPPGTALQHIQDGADTPIVHAILAAHLSRLKRFNSLRLLVALPKQVASRGLSVDLSTTKCPQTPRADFRPDHGRTTCDVQRAGQWVVRAD